MPSERNGPRRVVRPTMAAGPFVHVAELVLSFKDPIEMQTWVTTHYNATDTLEAVTENLDATTRECNILAGEVVELNKENATVVAERDEAQEALAESLGVIQGLQGQIANLTGENTALREQKRRMKFPDPPIFTGGKELPVEHWLVKMAGKMRADAEAMDTETFRMMYVFSRVGGDACGHLEPRMRQGATKPWVTAAEMLAHLGRVYGDPDRRGNAEYTFRELRQGQQEFNTFFAEFLRLSVELERSDAMLISDLTDKLSCEMQIHLATGHELPDSLLVYAERCSRVYQGLKNVARNIAATDGHRASEVNAPAASKRSPGTTHTAKTTVQRPRLSQSAQSRLMTQGRCFNCKDKGHMTAACTTNWKPMSSIQTREVV